MTAHATAAATPAAPQSRLALVLLIVLALHALLLLGLPHWAHTVPVTGGPPVFQTRTIALAAPPAGTPIVPPTPPSKPPEPHPEPPPPVQPANDQPVRPPRPDTPNTPDTLAIRNTPPAASEISPPAVVPDYASPPTAPVAGIAASAMLPSLLQAAPVVTFGGSSSPSPIAPPLPPDQVQAILRQAALPTPSASAASDALTPGTLESPPPIQLPRPAEVIYQATVTQGGRLVALSSTLDWRHDGQYYNLRWILYGPAIGDRSRYASGLVTARGLAPVTASKAGSDAYNLSFDYAHARLRADEAPAPMSNDVPPLPGNVRAGLARPETNPSATDVAAAAELPLLPGTQDLTSLLLQLGALIAGDPAQYSANSHIVLPVADGMGQALPLDFTVVDTNDQTAAGQFDGQRLPAVHLMHAPMNAQDMRIELWLSKQLDYLPTRMLLVRPNGDQLDMMLQSAYLQTIPAAPNPATPPFPAASSAGTAAGGSVAPVLRAPLPEKHQEPAP